MSIVSKLLELVQIQHDAGGGQVTNFNIPITGAEIRQIEDLLGEPLPIEVKSLYAFANGQETHDNGILFGNRFMSSREIIAQLEFSRSLVKPSQPNIPDSAASKRLLKKIVAFYIGKASKRRLLFFKKPWYKLELKFGPGAYTGPYIYPNEKTSSDERGILEIDSYEKIYDFVKQLHELEKAAYNWDEIELVIFSNGQYHVERKYYDFDNEILFTSIPENAIKKKYFHYKWLPLFSDHGGNFIGIDLDPDTNGTKGQVIIFGRDEEKMIVLSDGLEAFFTWLLAENKRTANKLSDPDYHLHDVLRELKLKTC